MPTIDEEALKKKVQQMADVFHVLSRAAHDPSKVKLNQTWGTFFALFTQDLRQFEDVPDSMWNAVWAFEKAYATGHPNPMIDAWVTHSRALENGIKELWSRFETSDEEE